MGEFVKTSLDGDVATVTLSRAPVNAFSAELVAEFSAAVVELSSVEALRVVVVRSDQKAFCAGADLPTIASFVEHADPAAQLKAFSGSLQEALSRFEVLDAVTVCEITGAAMGGGLELALAADFRVASRRARLGLPEVALGLIPAAGGTQRLARLCGVGLARRLILRGEILIAEQAHAAGLVDAVYAEDEFPTLASEFVAALAKQPGAALRASKRCIAHAQASIDAGLSAEVTEIGRLISRAEVRERITTFLNRGNRA